MELRDKSKEALGDDFDKIFTTIFSVLAQYPEHS